MPADARLTTDWESGLESVGLEVGPPLKAAEPVDAPADTVWQAISEPGNLKDCHPFCKETEVECWPGLGSRDSITYYSGIHYQRNFVYWHEGTGYDIELGDPPDQTARVLWRIEPTSLETSQISIEVFPLLKRDLPADKKQKYLERLFGDVLQHYLECVVKGVRHFAETGTPVSKDQFGKNALYSD